MKAQLFLFLMGTVFVWYMLRMWLGMDPWLISASMQMSYNFMLFMITLVLLGVLWLIRWLIWRWSSPGLPAGRIMACLFGYGVFPLACCLGSMAGGTYAAGITYGLAKVVGATLGEGMGMCIFILGISVGIFIITCLICLFYALVGLAVGSLMQRFIILLTQKLTMIVSSGSHMGAYLTGYSIFGAAGITPIVLYYHIFHDPYLLTKDSFFYFIGGILSSMAHHAFSSFGVVIFGMGFIVILVLMCMDPKTCGNFLGICRRKARRV